MNRFFLLAAFFVYTASVFCFLSAAPYAGAGLLGLGSVLGLIGMEEKE